jgi:hypothetical protein
MPGTKGRSGGRNRKPAQVHAIRGTWRADRHELPTIGATAPAVSLAEPPAALLDGLGPAGRKFLCAAYRDFELGDTEGHVARVAAQAYDDAEHAREHGDMKAARAAVRQFLAAIQRLGLPVVER